MKKIALILALVMVFAVALVACNETPADTSTPATESSAPADESKVEDTESSVPAEDSSVPEASEEPSAPAEITGENIAAGKAYTTSLLYRQRNVDPWDYDETADVAYPDTDSKEMTDGLIPESVASGESLYTAAEWIGLHGRCPDYEALGYAHVTVDLGAKTAITGVKVYVGTGVLGGGIGAPSSVEIAISDDGENWTVLTGAIPQNLADSNVECIALPCAAEGQYVQVRLTSGGWIFVSEVEVYA